MEEDDKMVEEPIVENEEKLEEDVDYSTTPWFEKPESEWDTDDAAEAKKALKTAMAQKAHWKKKAALATQAKPTAEENKPGLKKETNKNETLSSEDVISLATIVASGVNPDVLKEARELAKFKGISIQEALELPAIKAYAKELTEVTKKEKAQLGAANGSSVYQKFKQGMTPEQHRKLWEESIK